MNSPFLVDAVGFVSQAVWLWPWSSSSTSSIWCCLVFPACWPRSIKSFPRSSLAASASCTVSLGCGGRHRPAAADYIMQRFGDKNGRISTLLSGKSRRVARILENKGTFKVKNIKCSQWRSGWIVSSSPVISGNQSNRSPLQQRSAALLGWNQGRRFTRRVFEGNNHEIYLFGRVSTWWAT